MPPPRYLDIPAVAELLGVDPATVRVYHSRTRNSPHPFPAPAIRLSGRPGWNPEDVERWIAERPGRGKGERPNRRVNHLKRLEHLKTKAVGRGERLLLVTAYELGRVLGDYCSEEVELLSADGRIPVAAVASEVHENRPYLAFRYRELARWLTRDPHPELPPPWLPRRTRSEPEE